MGTKKSALSPAKQREVDRNSSAPQQAKVAAPEWAEWNTKVDRLSSRSLPDILHGWLGHIPEIVPSGAPPQEGVGSISSIEKILSQVPKKGDLVQPMSGARSAVLHEAIYLLHKAIHVQISCSRGVVDGKQTWAVVDAYQASLFALGSIMAFLGVTVEREGNNFILIDVWDSSSQKSGSLTKSSVEVYKFIRFKGLDHFHKWAILQRLLRTLKSRSPLADFVLGSIEESDIKSFALHRNTVHYQSSGWLANDLFTEDFPGPIVPAKTPQDLFDQIFKGSVAGTVFLMCALIELACEFAEKIFSQSVLPGEKNLIARRIKSRNLLTEFDWTKVGQQQISA